MIVMTEYNIPNTQSKRGLMIPCQNISLAFSPWSVTIKIKLEKSEKERNADVFG